MKGKFRKICAVVLSLSLILTAMPVVQTVSATQTKTPTVSSHNAYIVGELEERREESVKHFRMSDGSVMAIQYSEPVHYLGADKKYLEIDNTLKLSSDGNSYTNSSNNFKAFFPKKQDGSFGLEYEGHILSWKVKDNNNYSISIKNGSEISTASAFSTTAKNQSENNFAIVESKRDKLYSKVEYGSASAETKINYELSGKQIKESIILKSNPENNVFEYEFSANGLTATLQEDNSVIFYNSKKEAVYKIASPYMFDSAEVYSTDITVTLQSIKGGYLYTVTPSKEWLEAQERVYPVTVDPTIVPAYKATNIKDTTLAYASSGTASGYLNQYYLRIGKKTTLGQFEVAGAIYADLPTSMPATARIIKATVNLAFYSIQGPAKDSGIYLKGYKITGNWNAKNINEDIILYNNSNPTIPDASSDVLDYLKAVDTNDYKSSYQQIDITRAAQDWMHGGENHGIMIKMDQAQANAYNYVMIYSSDHGSNSPYFVFVYRDTTGLEDYWSYHSASAGNAGTGYVNDFNGNLTFISNIGGEATENYNLQLNLVYNSNNTANTQRVGNGWRLNVMQQVGTENVQQMNTTQSYYYYIDSDGTKHYFYNDNGTYKDEDNLGYVYTSVGSGSDLIRHKITTKDKTVLSFDSSGFLRLLEDPNGNTMRFNYTAHASGNYLSSITDTDNTVLFNFAYNGTITQLTSVTNARSGQSASFTYDTAGNLEKITNTSQEVTLTSTFVYSDKRLISATDDTGYKISYAYTQQSVALSGNRSISFYRVTQVTESALSGSETVNGQTLKIEYDSAIRTYFEDGGGDGDITTTADNNKSTYLFDNFGQPVTVYDKDGRASLYEYYNAEHKQHQLSASSYGNKTNENLLSDPSFEQKAPTYVGGLETRLITTDVYHGTKALSTYRSDTLSDSTVSSFMWDIPVQAGTYTFSIYVKSLIDEPININIYTSDSANDVSETLKHFKDSGWVKRQITVNIPADDSTVFFCVKRDKTVGTVLFDAAKLERSEYATDYSYVSSPSFQSPHNEMFYNVWDYWTRSSEQNVTTEAVTGHGGEIETALKILPAMQGDSSPYAKQVISVNGNEGDIYRLSGWAMASAMPRDDASFKIGAKVVYTDGTNKWHYLNFNKDIYNWQYGSAIVTTDDNDDNTQKTYSSIELYIYYANQFNAGYFDNIELVKDNATSYVYDENGNVISVKDSVSNSSYDFDGNSRLKNYADNTGNNFGYIYDSNNNLVSAIVNGGVEQTYTYNSFGEVTSTTVVANSYHPDISDGGVYYIRSKANGNYLDLSGTDIVLNDFMGNRGSSDVQKFTVKKTSDGYYTISPGTYNNTTNVVVENGANTDGAKIITSNSGTADAKKFKFEYTGGGAFRMVAKVSDGTKCIANYSQSTQNGSAVKLQTINTSNFNQEWYFEIADDWYAPNYQATIGKTYSIRNVGTGKYITVMSDTHSSGTEVKLMPRDGTTNQVFTIGNHEYIDAVYIKPIYSGDLAINAVYSDSSRYVNLAPSYGNDSQVLILKPVTSNPANNGGWCYFYKIIVYCTDDTVGSSASGNDFTVDEYSGLDDLWCFEEVSVSSSTATYSDDGERLLSTEDSRGVTTSYGYDNNNRLATSVKVKKGNETQITTTTYGEFDRVASVSSGNSSVNYTYNSTQLSSINAGGNVYTFTYDGFGNTLSTKIGNRTLASYSYLPYNKGINRLTYGNGSYVEYVYDNDGNVKQEKRNGIVAVTYDYDSLGRVFRIQDHTTGETKQYNYDFLGRVTSVSYSTSAVLAYSYDAKDRVSNRKTSANGITVNSEFSYNDFGQLSYFCDSLGNGQSYEVVYRFDHLKRPITRWMPVGFTTSYTYLQGEDNQATSLVDTLTIGSDCYRYTYDAFGNITAIYLNDQLYESYAYDGLNQLISVTRGSNTYEYTYDSRGNILSETKNGTVTKSYTYGDNDWKDLLTEYNGTDIDYDEIGNPLNWKNGETLTWSNGRRLMGIGNNISYTYNADGLRTSKTVNGTTTTFTYAEGLLLGETTGSNSIRYLYEDTSVPYGFVYNGTAYFYAFNVQGDVIGIFNDSGTKVVSYEYSAWGEVLSITGTLADTIGQINSIRYRGYYYDNETNLYYLQSRYYDAEVGRFLNADGVMGVNQDMATYNMFAYCGNNPVVRVDDGGQFWNYVIGGVVGAVVGGVSAAVSGGDWKSILLGVGFGAIGGVLAASGVPAGYQILAGGLLGGTSNLTNQIFIEGNNFKTVDWFDVAVDTAIGVGTSLISYGSTKNAIKAAEGVINKGISKVVSGKNILEATGRYGKGAIKKGLSIIRSGVKSLNTAQGVSSVIGSFLNGLVTSAKNFLKDLFW